MSDFASRSRRRKAVLYYSIDSRRHDEYQIIALKVAASKARLLTLIRFRHFSLATRAINEMRPFYRLANYIRQTPLGVSEQARTPASGRLSRRRIAARASGR